MVFKMVYKEQKGLNYTVLRGLINFFREHPGDWINQIIII